MIRALKYLAAWLAFVIYHTDPKAAHQCAKNSAGLPFGLLDKSEINIAAALACFLIAAAIAIAYIAWNAAT